MWKFNVEYRSTFSIRHSTFNIQHSAFSIHHLSCASASMLNRRDFFAGLGTLALTSACRSRTARGVTILRLSHSMTAGRTALHVLADTFREYAEQATSGAVKIRIFPSGTLGQEREVVQQLQEGLVDFMVSGTAIWGSVAPKIQVFDFPFLWRDWDHVHRAIDGGLGREAADYLERSVRMRPFAWGDSFGFRNAITTLQQRFYEVATHMARTRHIAGVLGLWASTATLRRLAPGIREVLEDAARRAADRQRGM